MGRFNFMQSIRGQCSLQAETISADFCSGLSLSKILQMQVYPDGNEASTPVPVTITSVKKYNYNSNNNAEIEIAPDDSTLTSVTTEPTFSGSSCSNAVLGYTLNVFFE